MINSVPGSLFTWALTFKYNGKSGYHLMSNINKYQFQAPENPRPIHNHLIHHLWTAISGVIA